MSEAKVGACESCESRGDDVRLRIGYEVQLCDACTTALDTEQRLRPLDDLIKHIGEKQTQLLKSTKDKKRGIPIHEPQYFWCRKCGSILPKDSMQWQAPTIRKDLQAARARLDELTRLGREYFAALDCADEQRRGGDSPDLDRLAAQSQAEEALRANLSATGEQP